MPRWHVPFHLRYTSYIHIKKRKKDFAEKEKKEKKSKTERPKRGNNYFPLKIEAQMRASPNKSKHLVQGENKSKHQSFHQNL